MLITLMYVFLWYKGPIAFKDAPTKNLLVLTQKSNMHIVDELVQAQTATRYQGGVQTMCATMERVIK